MRGHLVDDARFLHTEHLRILEPAADAETKTSHKNKSGTKQQNIASKLVHRAHKETKQCNGA